MLMQVMLYKQKKTKVLVKIRSITNCYLIFWLISKRLLLKSIQLGLFVRGCIFL